MHTFAQELKASKQSDYAKSSMPGRALSGQNRDMHPILHLQRTIGNQAVQRLPEPQLQHDCPCGGGCPKCQATHPVSSIQRTQLEPPSLTPQDVLHFQNTTGNQAVSRHTAQTTENASQIPVVQRAPSNYIFRAPGKRRGRRSVKCSNIGIILISDKGNVDDSSLRGKSMAPGSRIAIYNSHRANTYAFEFIPNANFSPSWLKMYPALPPGTTGSGQRYLRSHMRIISVKKPKNIKQSINAGVIIDGFTFTRFKICP